jgi:membrane protein
MKSLMTQARDRLWPRQEPTRPLWRALLMLARYLFALGRDIAAGDINLRAMSLVYTSMISIVPLLGFAFALAKALKFDEQLEPRLLELLQPLGPDYAARVADSVTAFTGNINGTALGVVSVALLLLIVLSMAKKVEGSFNFVWRVDRPRSFAQRFTEYLSVILIGPTIMLAASTMLASLQSSALVTWLAVHLPFHGAGLATFGRAVPYLMIIAAFTFLYMFIPNTRVRFRPAFIGGIAGGLAWATSGYLFAKLVVAAGRTESIYGGAAIVLVLMFWLYISWLVLLLGSSLAYYAQHPFQLRYGQRTGPLDNEARERLCLAVMVLVASDFAKPSHGWTNEGLASALRVPRESLEPIIAELGAAGLLVTAGEKRLIPGKDPHRIRLLEIVATVRGRERSRVDSTGSWSEGVNSIVDRIDDAIAAEIGERTLGQLVDAQLDKDEAH